jgi:hypothetical protein
VEYQAALREPQPSVSCPRIDPWMRFTLLPDFSLTNDCEGRGVVETRLRLPSSSRRGFICKSHSPEFSGMLSRISAARAHITSRSGQIQSTHQRAAHTISLPSRQNRLHHRGRRCRTPPIKGEIPLHPLFRKVDTLRKSFAETVHLFLRTMTIRRLDSADCTKSISFSDLFWKTL